MTLPLCDNCRTAIGLQTAAATAATEKEKKAKLREAKKYHKWCTRIAENPAARSGLAACACAASKHRAS